MTDVIFKKFGAENLKFDKFKNRIQSERRICCDNLYIIAH